MTEESQNETLRYAQSDTGIHLRVKLTSLLYRIIILFYFGNRRKLVFIGEVELG